MKISDDRLRAAEQSCLGLQLRQPELVAAPWLPIPSAYLVMGHSEIARALRTCGADAGVDAVCEVLLERGELEGSGGREYVERLEAQPLPSRRKLKDNARLVIESAKERQLSTALVAAQTILASDGPREDVLAAVGTELGLAQALLQPPAAATQGRMLDFAQLAPQKAPPKVWFRAGWLGTGATLFPGKGGEGKSTLAQHEATCGALGRPYFAGDSAPYTSLLWNCEDEHDDLWRRQEQICEHEGLELSGLAGRLFLVSRFGCDNALMVESGGALVPTQLLKQLRQQVNDLRIDVLWLDNVAHLMAGNHDDRTHATQFINALNGLVKGRPFGVVLLAHVSRALGSEFSGSVAWENAARMRWYLGNRLPDAPVLEEHDTAAPDTRYLCKRKSNYSARDYAKFTMRQGVLVPEEVSGDRIAGLASALDETRAEEHCLAGFLTLQGMGILPSDKCQSSDYLPRQIVEKGLAPGYSKQEITRALNRLMGKGKFVRGVVGRYSNSNPKHGLQLVEASS